MNSSHSPTLSTTDPLNTVPGALAMRPANSTSENNGDSFDTVYDNENASLERKDSNINALEEKKGNRTKSENAPVNEEETALSTSKQSGIAAHENSETERKDSQQLISGHITESIGNETGNEEHSLNIEPLTNIATPLTVNNLQNKGGEILPPSGKELPPTGNTPAQGLYTSNVIENTEAIDTSTLSEDESDLLLPRLSSQSMAVRNMDGLNKHKALNQAMQGSVYSHEEILVDGNQSKASLEALTENLVFAEPKPLKESVAPGTLLNSAPNSIAATSTGTEPVQLTKQLQSIDSASNTEFTLNPRSNSTDWSNTIGNKIRWMRNADVSTAEIKLNPAELGSIEIKIVTEDQQARVSFITTSATSKEIIEESLPRLKELLANNGIALDQSDISQKDNSGKYRQEARPALSKEDHIEQQLEHEISTSSIPPRIGQVDHYV